MTVMLNDVWTHKASSDSSFNCVFVFSCRSGFFWTYKSEFKAAEYHVSSSSVSQQMITKSSWSTGRRSWKLMQQQQLQPLQPKLWQARRSEDSSFLFILTLYMYHIYIVNVVCQVLINTQMLFFCLYSHHILRYFFTAGCCRIIIFLCFY